MMPVLPKSEGEETDKNGSGWLASASAGCGASNSSWTGMDAKRQTGSETSNQAIGSEEHITHCCLPSGCPNYYTEPIFLNDLGDSVKVYCNNETCNEGNWMHGECFREWESRVLSYLRSCGRARSWSEKQRAQNLWTKKGYDLAFKACDCKCGRGHLRQDLTYQPGSASLKKEDDRKQARKQRKRDRLFSTGSIRDSPSTNASLSGPLMGSNGGNMISVGSSISTSSIVNGSNQQRTQRTHRLSMSSTGSSSPPSSAGTTPCTPSGHFMPQTKKNKFDFFADLEQAASGNIFRHRTDLAAFGALPRRLQNPYHIKTEDDGPHGNDETRCFLLTNLSSLKVTSVACVMCQTVLYIYDKYPLIDGTFFLSPQRYNADINVVFEHRLLYLNAVCMRCMDGSNLALRCRTCDSAWMGTTLVIGTMYSYDVFASNPCCTARLNCKQCHKPVIDVGPLGGVSAITCPPLKYFSEYSHRAKCPHCGVEDYHFVKSLDEVFHVQKVAKTTTSLPTPAGLRL